MFENVKHVAFNLFIHIPVSQIIIYCGLWICWNLSELQGWYIFPVRKS